jgi:hypothetical protein
VHEHLLTLARQIEVARILLWAGLGVVGVLIAAVVVLGYRRRLLGPHSQENHAGLMDELREMRNRGELSEEEFAAAKRSMVARLSGNAPAQLKPRPSVGGDRIAPPGVDLTGQPLPRPPVQPPTRPPDV